MIFILMLQNNTEQKLQKIEMKKQRTDYNGLNKLAKIILLLLFIANVYKCNPQDNQEQAQRKGQRRRELPFPLLQLPKLEIIQDQPQLSNKLSVQHQSKPLSRQNAVKFRPKRSQKLNSDETGEGHDAHQANSNPSYSQINQQESQTNRLALLRHSKRQNRKRQQKRRASLQSLKIEKHFSQSEINEQQHLILFQPQSYIDAKLKSNKLITMNIIQQLQANQLNQIAWRLIIPEQKNKELQFVNIQQWKLLNLLLHLIITHDKVCQLTLSFEIQSNNQAYYETTILVLGKMEQNKYVFIKKSGSQWADMNQLFPESLKYFLVVLKKHLLHNKITISSNFQFGVFHTVFGEVFFIQRIPYRIVTFSELQQRYINLEYEIDVEESALKLQYQDQIFCRIERVRQGKQQKYVLKVIVRTEGQTFAIEFEIERAKSKNQDQRFKLRNQERSRQLEPQIQPLYSLLNHKYVHFIFSSSYDEFFINNILPLQNENPNLLKSKCLRGINLQNQKEPKSTTTFSILRSTSDNSVNVIRIFSRKSSKTSMDEKSSQQVNLPTITQFLKVLPQSSKVKMRMQMVFKPQHFQKEFPDIVKIELTVDNYFQNKIFLYESACLLKNSQINFSKIWHLMEGDAFFAYNQRLIQRLILIQSLTYLKFENLTGQIRGYGGIIKKSKLVEFIQDRNDKIKKL